MIVTFWVLSLDPKCWGDQHSFKRFMMRINSKSRWWCWLKTGWHCRWSKSKQIRGFTGWAKQSTLENCTQGKKKLEWISTSNTILGYRRAWSQKHTGTLKRNTVKALEAQTVEKFKPQHITNCTRTGHSGPGVKAWPGFYRRSDCWMRDRSALLLRLARVHLSDV